MEEDGDTASGKVEKQLVISLQSSFQSFNISGLPASSGRSRADNGQWTILNIRWKFHVEVIFSFFFFLLWTQKVHVSTFISLAFEKFSGPI